MIRHRTFLDPGPMRGSSFGIVPLLTCTQGSRGKKSKSICVGLLTYSTSPATNEISFFILTSFTVLIIRHINSSNDIMENGADWFAWVSISSSMDGSQCLRHWDQTSPPFVC